jgi:hypothetical protein
MAASKAANEQVKSNQWRLQMPFVTTLHTTCNVITHGL